jgi:S-DNA-T family DNA segregation ATPase FtsK/SpoIIIE
LARIDNLSDQRLGDSVAPVESCSECGYGYGATSRAGLAAALRDRADAYRPILVGMDEEAVRLRPAPGVWSVLEYCCHVRDLLAVQRERVTLALAEDEADFASMRREERVIEERYNEQEPRVVAEELEGAAGALAGLLESLDDAGWGRTGMYHWPVTKVRSVEWIGRHSLHECVHHLQDIAP